MANLLKDKPQEEDKFKQNFFLNIRKLDVGNSVKQRVSAIKELS
jgi:hypothetical protein